MHIVMGASASDRVQLIARLCGERKDWIGFVGACYGTEALHANLKVLATGCPCCTGKLMLQISLAKALRARPAVRAFVEVADPAHAGMLEKALCEAPLDRALIRGQPLALPSAAHITPVQIEAGQTRD